MNLSSAAKWKKKKGGRWCVTHPPHRPRPPLLPPSLLPLMLESPHISVARGKREHYTNDIEKGLEEGWGCALTQFCWALCRPQPCRPIKVADAVQGPLTAADMPLANHGESLAGREALPPPQAWPTVAQAWLILTHECRGGLEEASQKTKRRKRKGDQGWEGREQ